MHEYSLFDNSLKSPVGTGEHTDTFELFEQLLRAENETDVDEVLKTKGYLSDDPGLWQPFGGFGMNLNQINNQQSDATAALVEKLINSIDAVLLAKCYEAGINPKGPMAPATMSAAVEKLFKVKEGRLENLSPQQQGKLADSIQFIVTGSKKEPSFLIVDRGEGQTASAFPDTFLSLTKQNKDDIPFVQGRFNCGGTGVLPFCGERKYQLIASRRHPNCPATPHSNDKDLWAFTLVRRQKAAPGHKSSMYVYLAPKNHILTFDRSSIPALPGPSSKGKPSIAYSVPLEWGTCIKLYNYRWRAKSQATTEARYELEKYLHSVSLPIRITETRAYNANYYSTTLSGILGHVNEDGTEETASKFEKGLGPAYGNLDLPGIGHMPYKLFLIKSEYDPRRFPHGVFFTLNGQVHGDLPANFIASSLKFDFLKESLLVSVDCTAMDQAVREDFLMASRDRVRRNEAYESIYAALRDELREHPGLREHNAQRKKQLLEKTLSKQENSADYLQELLKSDPTLATILGVGGNVISTTGPTSTPIDFDGKKFPTFFRISKEPKDGLTKDCPLNKTVHIEFETDAENGYFDRADSPGAITFVPPNLCATSHLWNGRFFTKFQMPYDAQVGEVIEVTATITDIERDAVQQPFLCKFKMRGKPESSNTNPPGTPPAPGQKHKPNGKHSSAVLASPEINEVRKEDWASPQLNFDEYSAIKIMHSVEDGGYSFWINMDNRFLINELHKTKDAESSLVKYWFKYGLVLAALGMLKESERVKETAPKDTEQDSEQLDPDKISILCAGLARVIVPIVRALRKGPELTGVPTVAAV